MRRRVLVGAASLVLSAGVLLAVLCYNTWSYCCGNCTLANFLDPGPFGLLLLALDLVAALVLLVLRRRAGEGERCTRCGTPCSTNWAFCSACGTALSAAAEQGEALSN